MGDWYSIEGIGDVAQLVRRTPGFDPRLHDGFRSEYYVLWNRIGPESTIKELLMCGEVTPSHALIILRSLVEIGAVRLRPPTNDDFEIVDQTELGALSAQEHALLREEVDLAPWEKRRILAVLRMVEAGDTHELLGVSPNATKRDLKRAYYALSKEFHPDRYYGKRLGGYKALLERIFQTAGNTVKTLSDSRTVVPGALQSSRRRRGSPRFPYAAPVKMRCSSWSEVRQLMTEDVSDGGLFVPTDIPATTGERVALVLSLPGGDTLELRGTVASARTAAEAGRGLPPGVGIRLDTLPPQSSEKFARLLSTARDSLPAPAAEPVPEPRRRLARGTRPVRRQTPIVGIDLGTSYTSISAAVGNNGERVSVLTWPNGLPAIPSVVSFPSRGSVVVGQPARERLLTDPKHTVPAAKRLLGRRADDRELEAHLAQAGYDTLTGADGSVIIDMWGEPYAIPQLCSYLLAEAKEAAERALGGPVDRAVVTVPVSFTEDRIELMRLAGRLAHLDILEVIDEPSAAALANRYRPQFGGLIGVYDFGGGTFDFSVVDARGGDFRVLATAGDSWLGGDDLDFAVAEAVANKFWRVHGVDVRERAAEWQQLLFQCERAKRTLSTSAEARIHVPEVFRTAAGAMDLRMRLTRGPIDRLWAEPIRRSLATSSQALALLGLRPSSLSAVYLSGGTSYVPAVRRALEDVFGVPVHAGVPPEFAACLGAGIHAAQLERRVATTLQRID